MKFDYLVKHNGVYYPAGTDVPIEKPSGEGVKAPAVDVSEKDLVKDDKVLDKDLVKDKRKYTDEDLDVPYFSLLSMAKKEGLDVPDKPKTSELKKMLRAL